LLRSPYGMIVRQAHADDPDAMKNAKIVMVVARQPSGKVIKVFNGLRVVE